MVPHTRHSAAEAVPTSGDQLNSIRTNHRNDAHLRAVAAKNVSRKVKGKSKSSNPTISVHQQC